MGIYCCVPSKRMWTLALSRPPNPPAFGVKFLLFRCYYAITIFYLIIPLFFFLLLLLNRPYALTSRLHNNDAMLGVKTCRAARTCFAGRAHWRSPSQSVCAPGPARRCGMQGFALWLHAWRWCTWRASFDPQHHGGALLWRHMHMVYHCCGKQMKQMGHKIKYGATFFLKIIFFPYLPTHKGESRL